MKFNLTEKEKVEIDRAMEPLYPNRSISHEDVKMFIYKKELKNMLKRLSRVNMMRFCYKHPKVVAKLLKEFLS